VVLQSCSLDEEKFLIVNRLLLKVRLPDGPESFLGLSNVGLPPLPPDTDLDEFLTGPDVLMVRIAGGATWPALWDVAFD